MEWGESKRVGGREREEQIERVRQSIGENRKWRELRNDCSIRHLSISNQQNK